MKKLSILCVMIVTLIVGFTSCDSNEEFETCPDITINIDNVPGSTVYRFVAQLDDIDDIRFTWSIDGEEVDTGNLSDLAGQIFDYSFEPGEHTVCVKVANDDCPIEVCKDIVVIRDDTDPCPDLFFETRQLDTPSNYKFIADFSGIEDTRFEWFINDELIADNNTSNDNYLFWEFEAPGTYEVCIKTETPDCPNGTSYCKVIEVAETDVQCPEVSFDYSMESDVHVFEASIEGSDDAREINWFVDGSLVEDAEGKVLKVELEDGEHEVCLQVITETCPNGVKYCKEITTGGDSCPEPFFSRDGDYLYADFQGMNDLEWYGWYVDEELIENEGSSNDGNNKLSLENLASGTYTICIFYESPECPNGAKFCKEITIERGCPELRFDPEQDGDNNAYYFYPTAFDGIDDVTLSWYANDEFIGNSPEFPHNNPFYYQFAPGRYEICLKVETPDCPSGTSYCKVIEIQEPADCPDLFFEIVQEGNTSGYNFYSDFDGMSDVSYEWRINGDIVDVEYFNSNDRDDYLYYQFGAGTYEICIFAETPDCPYGTSFCKTIVIE